MKQLHKKFTDYQIKELITRYLEKKIADSPSIFRFVQGRDSFWRNHYRLTDEADPQWKQVLEDCG